MSDESEYHLQVLKLLESNQPFVAVTLLDAIGSAPQNPGARMLVSDAGLLWGTIGGGKIEMACLAKAAELLKDKHTGSCHYLEWNLQRDIGMTCGGVVRLYFECYVQQTWNLAIFGAGHVAQALIPVLTALKCRLWCLDSRPEWLERLPQAANLTILQLPSPADQVPLLPRNTFLVSMTMGHAHDLPILAEALRIRRDDPAAFPFIGVIGSPAKAGVIQRDLTRLGFSKTEQQAIICPLGLAIGNNDPAEMAISISGQLLQVRDALLGGGKWSRPGYQKRNQKKADPA